MYEKDIVIYIKGNMVKNFRRSVKLAKASLDNIQLSPWVEKQDVHHWGGGGGVTWSRPSPLGQHFDWLSEYMCPATQQFYF